MLITLINISRPFELLLSALAYALGASILRYGDIPISSSKLILGFTCVILLQLFSNMLQEYFSTPTSISNDSNYGQRAPNKTTLLKISLCSLLLSCTLFLVMFVAHHLWFAGSIIFLFIGILYAIYSGPPLRLVYSGYGEMTVACIWAILIPSWAYFLQTERYEPLLGAITIPLFYLTMTYPVVKSLVTYPVDQKKSASTLLIRIGWEKIGLLLSALQLLAYILFGTSLFFKNRAFLIWPILISLPFGIWEVLWINRVLHGGRFLQKPLLLLSRFFIGISYYSISLAFWLR
jgi:1,4-dihydroxy-2-naphthoate octaprenyltransferase